jgi:spermidine synthase
VLGRRILLLAIFAASGASGLVYELIWVRQFGTLFGSSVYSAAVVTAIYMCGLGFGAWAVAGFADRRFLADPVAPLRWYGRFELAIAVLAVLVMIAMPQLARVAATASSYQVGAHGWLWPSAWSALVRYGCAALLLLPITLLMGGTLTLLIRFVVAGDLSRVGWQVGLLYGVNTIGATLGCLATDTMLVPLLGIRAAQAIAIGGSLFAAAGAGWLARRSSAPPCSAAAAPIGEVRFAWLALALAAAGFASMAMQIAWFRQLSAMFGSFRPVLSLLLSVILVGIWLGALLAGRVSGRAFAPAAFAIALAGFALSALAGVALLRHDASTFAVLPSPGTADGAPWLTLYARLLGQIAWVVGPPALCAGAAFPLANAIAQGHRDHVGGRAGLLYLANTVGGVFGSLAAAFAFLPRLGIQWIVTAVIASALVALLGLWRAVAARSPEERSTPVVAASAAVVLLSLVVWRLLPGDFLVRRSLPLAPDASGRGVVAIHEGVNETLAIVANPGPSLGLITNSHGMSGTSFANQRYMSAFVHVPMLLDPGIANVLVMCFGVGNTARAALLHPQVREVEVVDISPDVLGHARYFESANGRPLDDPRVSVYVNDARRHLLMKDAESYDLITGEPPPITHAGSVNLYTREFFALLHSRLRVGGFATYWLPLWQVGEDAARAIVRAFLDAFPGAVLLSGYGSELILVGRKQGSIEIDPERVMRRQDELPALREDLRGLELAGVDDLVGMLAATAPTLERATHGAAPLRDDRPLLEYALRALDSKPRIPSDLVSVDDVDRWCPRCFTGALDAASQVRLRGYLEVIALYYQSDAFRAEGAWPPHPAAALSAEARRAVADHPYLQDLLGELPPLYSRALHLARHGRVPGAIASLEALLRRDPGNSRARADLARLRERIAVR